MRSKTRSLEAARVASGAWRKANRERHRAYAKTYAESHVEQLKARAKARYWANPEKICTAVKEYYQQHRQERLAYAKAYRQSHREARRLLRRAYDRLHPEAIRRRVRMWRIANPEKHKMNAIKYTEGRRARIAGVTVGVVDLEAIKRRDRTICWLCRKRVAKADLSFDHVTPLVVGGSHSLENLRVAHKKCNSRKNRALICLPFEAA